MLGRLLGVGAGGHRVVAALRLDIKAVQAEQLGVVARRHRVEGALGRGAVAGELRRLRAEQQRERLARRDARRASSANFLAARTSPEPTAISPCDTA